MKTFSKKRKGVFPSDLAVLIGIVFIFAFFSIATFKIAQFKKDGSVFKKVVKKERVRKVSHPKVFVFEKNKIQKDIDTEVAGMLLAASQEEIIVEIGESEAKNAGKVLMFQTDPLTRVVFSDKKTKENPDIAANFASLEIGQVISVKESSEEGSEGKVEVIRILK